MTKHRTFGNGKVHVRKLVSHTCSTQERQPGTMERTFQPAEMCALDHKYRTLSVEQLQGQSGYPSHHGVMTAHRSSAIDLLEPNDEPLA